MLERKGREKEEKVEGGIRKKRRKRGRRRVHEMGEKREER